jgi:DNA-binding GntR family transcriptional regulator
VAPRGSYLQIAADLRHQLEAGELPPGSMLPSENSLAREYSVSRGTARAALAVLADAGLVEVVPGQGRRIVGATDARTATTAWEKVAADLRRRLRTVPTGENPLPSEAELSAEHGVSRNTVRRAYRQLIEEGLVVVRHGAGAFPTQGHDHTPNATHDR